MALPRLISSQPIDPALAAESAIRNFCGWHVAPALDMTLRLNGSGTRKLLLPSNHVNAVSSVVINGTSAAPEMYSWAEDGWLTLAAAWWPEGDRNIAVTLNHGWPFEESAEIAGVVRAIMARAAMNPSGAIINQRAGTQGFGIASAGAQAASFPLLQQEKDLLAPFALKGTP